MQTILSYGNGLNPRPLPGMKIKLSVLYRGRLSEEPETRPCPLQEIIVITPLSAPAQSRGLLKTDYASGVLIFSSTWKRAQRHVA
jgi:hypothetical protein